MEAVSPAPPVAAMDYPAQFDVEYPERLSRWKIFVKWLLAIPHFIIVGLLLTVNSVLVLIAFFSILFTKKWPRGLFRLLRSDSALDGKRDRLRDHPPA
jgi:hypothetical protein